MRHAWIAVLFLIGGACSVAAQEAGTVFYQTAAVGIGTGMGGMLTPGAPVTGAPYSATATNESVQTLGDGNRIVHSSSGTIARDTDGRTRQDTPLPALGNLAAAYAPHLVFIKDPVAGTDYILNLTNETAQKMALSSMQPLVKSATTTAKADAVSAVAPAGIDPGPVFMARVPPPGAGTGPMTAGMGLLAPMPPALGATAGFVVKGGPGEGGQTTREDLGSQTMENVYVTGVRTTVTIPAGQIGNEQPIRVVTEVWTSPDLKVTVLSKRSDPRMGEQTYRLTNILRGQPNPSLFTVPRDFQISEGPQNFIYRTNPSQ